MVGGGDGAADLGLEAAVVRDLLEVGVALGGGSGGGCAGYAVAVLGLGVSLGASFPGDVGSMGDIRWSFWGLQDAQRDLGVARDLESLFVKS